jgi:hypothetical protein
MWITLYKKKNYVDKYPVIHTKNNPYILSTFYPQLFTQFFTQVIYKK